MLCCSMFTSINFSALLFKINTIMQWNASTSKVANTLLKLRTSFQNVRKLLKQMGTEANVDIEPDAQSSLIDATMNLPGVLICGGNFL